MYLSFHLECESQIKHTRHHLHNGIKVRVLKEYVLILVEWAFGIRSRRRQAQTPAVAENLFGIHVSEENM